MSSNSSKMFYVSFLFILLLGFVGGDILMGDVILAAPLFWSEMRLPLRVVALGGCVLCILFFVKIPKTHWDQEKSSSRRLRRFLAVWGLGLVLGGCLGMLYTTIRS